MMQLLSFSCQTDLLMSGEVTISCGSHLEVEVFFKIVLNVLFKISQNL